MKKTRLFLIALSMLLILQTTAWAASGLDFDGTVVGGGEVLVTAPIGGTAEAVNFDAGDRVSAGDVLVSLKTNKVYATETGTITGLFAAEGDSITAVESRYGAVLYIEPTGKYTISATTEKAYDSASTKYIHVGETVYLACTSDAEHTGTGIVTAVSGTTYTVDVTSGGFYMDETVNIYRKPAYNAGSRLGRGDVARIANVSATGSGSIVKLYVQNGDSVQRGDLLFETLDGEYDGYYCTGSDIRATVSGILSEVKVAQGDTVSKNGIVAAIYPSDAMQVEFSVGEADLSDIAEGDQVSITFNWSEDIEDAPRYEGTIASISHVATTSTESTEASFNAYVDFAAGEEVRLGMTVVVSLAGAPADETAEDPDAADFAEDDEETAAETPAEDPNASDFPADRMPPSGEMPTDFEMPTGVNP